MRSSLKCFYHHDRDAVGTCHACLRGLCPDCAADLGRGLACKGRCEIEVRRLHDLRDFSLAQPGVQKQVLQKNKSMLTTMGLMMIAGAALIAIWEFLRIGRLGTGSGVAAFIGLFGALMLISGLRQPKDEQFRLCKNCGYNISRNTTNRCPECGFQT